MTILKVQWAVKDLQIKYSSNVLNVGKEFWIRVRHRLAALAWNSFSGNLFFRTKNGIVIIFNRKLTNRNFLVGNSSFFFFS